MAELIVDKSLCDLCQKCVAACPFNSLSVVDGAVSADATCRMCNVCVKTCPQKALSFEKVVQTVDKKEWNDILVYVELEEGKIHPVAYELIGEARKLASNVGYHVNAVVLGGKGTAKKAEKLLPYGVHEVFVYEDDAFETFKVDSYTNAVADCIEAMKPSSILIGATALGRSVAPRLATRFHTGLTADCTKLEMKENTDLVQIRPAFGGNIMAQILITNCRPQFATVRYKVMDTAEKVEHPSGKITLRPVTAEMTNSKITILERKTLDVQKAIEEEEILVVAGRGVKDDQGVELLDHLAKTLGGQLCFTRPMIEAGYGDIAHQIGLSGRTVKPKLIITCGVMGAIQFSSCIRGAECIVAINSDPDALIFNIANYCIVDDLYKVVPELLASLQTTKEGE